MIFWETARSEKELRKALRKVIQLARIAIKSGRIIGIDLKEMEDPMFTQKDRVALGLIKFSGTCSTE